MNILSVLHIWNGCFSQIRMLVNLQYNSEVPPTLTDFLALLLHIYGLMERFEIICDHDDAKQFLKFLKKKNKRQIFFPFSFIIIFANIHIVNSIHIYYFLFFFYINFIYTKYYRLFLFTYYFSWNGLNYYIYIYAHTCTSVFMYLKIHSFIKEMA